MTNWYFTDGRYNASNFPVARAELSGLSDALPAYTIEPPQNGPSEFLGTRHGLFYRFDEAADWTVYELADGALKAVARIAAADVSVDGYTRVGDLVANDTRPRTLVFARADRRTSTFTALADGAEGARLDDSAVGRVVQVQIPLPGPPLDTVADYTDGPSGWGNTYGFHRIFHTVRRGDGPGLVWQDVDDGTLYATWLDETDPSEFETVALAGGGADVLLAGANADDAGAVTCLLVGAGDGRPESARPIRLVRSNADGSEAARNDLDGGTGALNIAAFHPTASERINHAVMRRSGNRLGIFLARFIHRTNDGLNHQSGMAFTVDAETLAFVGGGAQTSGHSWGSVLQGRGEGRFLGADLGDNYPRGVNLHRLAPDGSFESRIVFTFKTQHGTQARSPAGRDYPEYEEISTPEQTYYQWSNDNRTYTELGGIAETDEGVVVVFATERSLLDNRVVGGARNEPRELAMVRVDPDFAVVPFGGDAHVVTDDVVLSRGEPTVESSFYDFGGGQNRQRVTGVVFLTDLAADQNASRPKLHQGPAGLVALYEVWRTTAPDSDAFVETHALRLDAGGLPIAGQAAPLGGAVRLANRDDPFTLAGGTAVAAGDRANRRLVVSVVLPR